MNGPADFATSFEHLARTGQGEQTLRLGGVTIRMVRIAGGGEGRWDSHAHTAETVVVWSGDFKVEFSDHSLELAAGQCCVVPIGAQHRGTSRGGAEIVLFTSPAS